MNEIHPLMPAPLTTWSRTVFGQPGLNISTFEEINLGKRDRFDNILMSGWRPGTAPDDAQ